MVSIEIYNKGGQSGLATAVLVSGDTRSVIFEKNSITQIRKALPEFKKSRGWNRVPTKTFLDQAWDFDQKISLVGNFQEQEQAHNKFSINERFDMISDVVKMVANKKQESLVVTGNGGCGKTYTILETLRNMGFKKISPNITHDKVETDKGFRHFKGGCSPTELFKLLHDFNEEILVFDDFDSVLKSSASDPIMGNLLKAALDSFEEREITWFSPLLKREGYPSSFNFKGNIIFISNFPMSKIPDPLKSRSLVLDLHFTKDDIVERIKHIADKMTDLDSESISEVLEWIEQNKNTIKNLSLRTFAKVAKFKAAGFDNWKSLASYAT